MSDPAAARDRTIALVEHHADRLALLSRGLQEAGFAVLAHADAASLATADLAPPPGLYLLDLSNSGEPGLALIGELRRRAAAPIIVIAGKVSAAARASGLELGADDHVAWPCDMRELVARIEALLRRQELAAHATRPAALQEWTFGAWRVDSLARRLRGADDRSVELTASEYRLLEILVMHPGQTHSRASLLESIYERPWMAGDRSIDNLVVRLRRKLGEDPRAPRLIRTVRGGGYVLTAAVRVTRRRDAASARDGAER